MAAFDLATAIAEFCADPARTSLELPHMTTGQRKNAKQLVSQYSDVRCESYGFGADRQLHLFKGSIAAVNEEDVAASGKAADFSRFNVNIKNTFIDDWVAPTVNERRAVQTMPHDMFRHCIWAEMSEESKEGTGYDTPTTTGCDTVCDTASEPEAESMPCPLAESHGLPIGGLVVVEGLAKMPAFNGCSAVVQGWDEETGRYNILIAGPSGCREAKIKNENLRLVSTCP